MPAKYHIHTRPAPPRFKPVGKYAIIDWREDCSACHNCVKRECAYSVYNDERDRLLQSVDYVDYLYECKGCLCCVQSCTKGLLSWQVNPQYLALGDEVWTADIISSTWYQSETGAIPVSGAGYPGPFRGPGFDSILTDMSEIVRPTRDGIHGREYISTQVDIGRKPMRLSFNPDGSLATDVSPVIEIPLPIIFNLMPWHELSLNVSRSIMDAANELATYAISDEPELLGHSAAVPHLTDRQPAPAGRTLIEFVDTPDVAERIARAKTAEPNLLAIVKLPLGSASIQRALQLARQGIDALHCYADWRGIVQDGGERKHITEAVRELHLAFVGEGIRDEITLIASGGISMAEHVVKTILCGADLVAVDVPLMIALECRVCMNCTEGLKCPVKFEEIDTDYAVQRIVNLMGAWHSQLLEMMGAMGIREARRLRGEVGRAMFFDDLERECFGPIFGQRKASAEVR
ncbi:MAG: glutamate synthase-related protein [Armatimonadota bacterium]|nr:glutamate synthase-related protein [Armatimonadota bacterium]